MASPNQANKPINESEKMAEKEEESKLKAKYPQLQRPGPQFLQKRLQKGQRYFDSGDYNMAKAAAKNKIRLPESKLNQAHPLPPAASVGGVGLVGGNPLPPPPPATTGEVIPTPDCLATRKTSIHVPSKLVSGGP